MGSGPREAGHREVDGVDAMDGARGVQALRLVALGDIVAAGLRTAGASRDYPLSMPYFLILS